MVELHISDPFKIVGDENNLFVDEISKKQGLYLWTIKDKDNDDKYFVNYVGITYGKNGSFGNRIQTEIGLVCSGLWSTYNAEAAKSGKEKFEWKGKEMVSEYNLSEFFINFNNDYFEKVKSYLEAIEIFCLEIEGGLKKDTPIHRIEHKIGKILYNKQKSTDKYGKLLHKLLKTSKDEMSEKTKNILIKIKPEERVNKIYGLEKEF